MCPMTSHRLPRSVATATISALALACLPVIAAPAHAATSRSIILNAFGDAAGTYGESKPFLAALAGRVDRSAESAYCEVVVEGTIDGQPVTVVVTGTGGANAGPCTQEMLGWYAPGITEFIWSGIGGASPAVGGLYDGSGKRKADPTPVMIGDVCVGTMSWSYDLHFSNVNDWAAGKGPSNRYDPSGGWWRMQDSRGHEQAPGFQGVQQFVVADRALADEVLHAARTASLPKASRSVQLKVKRFYPDRADWRPAKVWSYRDCGGEVAGDNFWHGTAESDLARRYIAALMTAADVRPGRVRADDVIAFSAMEATPWMSVVKRWNVHNGTSFPMVVIRGASNYDQMPLRADGTPILNAKGRPLTAMEDILIGFDSNSGDYAAATAAAPVLEMFRLRAAR